MYTETDLQERLIIIKDASLSDAQILDENYRFMISQTCNYEERHQYLKLKELVHLRINLLTKESR